MKFEEILLKEPRLIPIISDCHTVKSAGTVYKNRLWYKEFKPQMSRLVGFHCENSELSSTEIYDTVYQFLITLLEI